MKPARETMDVELPTDIRRVDGREIVVEHSTGNVFADLGVPDPEGELIKAKIVALIDDVVRNEFGSPSEAAAAMGLSPSDLSNVLRGRDRNLSVERLLEALSRINRLVEIRVRGVAPDQGGIEVAVVP